MIKYILIFLTICSSIFSYSFKQIGQAHGLKVGNFGKPIAVSIDEDKNIYILDYLLEKLVVFDKNKQLIKEFSDLKTPSFFRIIDGKIYISESIENRVTVINNYSGTRKILGSSGMREGEFFHPGEILEVKDKIYIADEYNNRIQIFEKNGEFLTQLMLPKFRYDFKPYYSLNYSLQYKGNSLYVLDNFNKKVYIFRENKLAKEYDIKNIKNPTKLYLINDKVYIHDSVDDILVSLFNDIIELDIDIEYQLIGLNHFYVSGNKLAIISDKELINYDVLNKKSDVLLKLDSISKSEYIMPIDVKTDKAGNIYVLDKELEKIIIYNKYNEYVGVIDEIGEKPTSLHIDEKYNILVSLPFENKFKKYNKRKELVNVYGGYQRLPTNEAYYYEEELKEAVEDVNKLDQNVYNLDVTVDELGNFYILDSKSQYIKTLSPFFEEKGHFGKKASFLSVLKGNKQEKAFGWNEMNKNNLTDIYYFGNKIYVLDSYYNRVTVYQDGEVVAEHEEEYSENGLNSIYVDKNYIYVVDSYNFTIHKYDHEFDKKEEISFLKHGLIPLRMYENFVIFKKQLKDYEAIYLVLDIQNLL